MQLQISSRDLLRSISAVAKVLQSKNSLPVLGSVLFSQTSPSSFALTGSDGENELTADIELTVLEGPFIPFCVKPKLLQTTLSTLGDQPLTLSVLAEGDNVTVNVRYLNGQFSVSGYRAEEYPRIKTAETELCHFVSATPNLLVNMAAAMQCTAGDELRPSMSAVCLDVCSDDPNSPMPDRVVVVGSDGHMLYKNIISQGNDLSFKKIDGKATLLVHRNLVSTLTNAFRGVDNIEVIAMGKILEEGSFTVHNIIFRAPGVEFITRAIEGRYPNYNSVIPAQHLYSAVFDVKPLMQSIKRVSQFASESSQLTSLQRQGFETILSAVDIDFSKSSKESIDVKDCNLVDNYAIGFKSSSLLQHLGCISTNSARIELSEPSRPIIIKEDDHNSTLTLLLMPMALQQ